MDTYLQYTGVSCLAKSEGFDPDGAQWFALSVLLLFASISLIGTLVHALNIKSYFVKPTRSLSKEANNSNDLRDESNKVPHFSIVHHQQKIALLSQKPGDPIETNIQVASKPTDSLAPASRYISETTRLRLLVLINILNNFSIIKNGTKLFDTSSSKPRGNVNLIPTEHISKSNGAKRIMSDIELSTSTTSGSEAGCSSSSQSSSSIDNPGDKSNDISCVHGLRFWTISWIVLAHTMQYTEWAGFGRAYVVEENIVSIWLHPLLNATFSVDTFFLISGLLTTYVTWSITGGEYRRFNKFAFLISRYLRLTPQVLVVLLLFIIFPLAGDGPYWRGLVQKHSDHCKRNWWISALYLQSFVRPDQIVSVLEASKIKETLYHFS